MRLLTNLNYSSSVISAPEDLDISRALDEVAADKNWSCFRIKERLKYLRSRIVPMQDSERKTSLLHDVEAKLLNVDLDVRKIQKKFESLQKSSEKALDKEYDVLHTHLVLDSVYQPNFTDEGIYGELVLQFFKRVLAKFPREMSAGIDSKWTCGDVMNLIEDAIWYEAIIADTDRKRCVFAEHSQLLPSLIGDRLEEMEAINSRKPPFLILPVHTNDHAMIILIDYSEERKFTITVFDTIGFENGKTVRYRKYLGLTREDLYFLPAFAETRACSPDRYLDLLKTLLPENVRTGLTEKGHRSQNGEGSCASKSMMVALRQILSEEFYKELKVALTIELQGRIQAPLESKYGQIILEKRMRKARIASIEVATRKLRLDKSNPIYRERLASTIKEVGLRDSVINHNIFNASRLAIRRLRNQGIVRNRRR